LLTILIAEVDRKNDCWTVMMMMMMMMLGSGVDVEMRDEGETIEDELVSITTPGTQEATTASQHCSQPSAPGQRCSTLQHGL